MNQILGADRALAQIAVDDCVAGHRNPRKIAQAEGELALGDEAVADAWYERGIRLYREAWDGAQAARHR